MTSDDVRALLRAEVEKAGSQIRYAREHHLSQSHLANVLRGMDKPGPRILGLLGLREVRSYEPISCPAPAPPEGPGWPFPRRSAL